MRSYGGTIVNIGHRLAKDVLLGRVQVEEKIDGSQISFGLVAGELQVRSKGAQLILDAPEKLFTIAVEQIRLLELLLNPEYTYRGEYLAKPKHNALAYDRIPKAHIIIFDIERGEGDFLTVGERDKEAGRLGLETVPLLFLGVLEDAAQLRTFLDTPSILGGQKIEGVVVKPVVPVWGPDHKAVMGKFVSEAFKEVHGGEWREANPTSGDIVTQLVKKYKTPARWLKAVQHLKEAGQLTDSPKDIGPLMKESALDLLKEEQEAIKEAIFKWVWPKLQRACAGGLPEWYKQLLLTQAFEKEQV